MKPPAGRGVILALLVVGMAAPACAIPPWSMGAPLDGKPSIPPTTAAPSVPRLHALARAENLAGHAALELRALLAIAVADRLSQEERARTAVLLEERATELLAIGRAVPACSDLRQLEGLAPARARALAAIRAVAERDAGDAWLAVGDRRRARDAYQVAAALGAEATDFRLLAAAEAPPAHLEPGLAETAVLTLPLRAVPPFAEIGLGQESSASASASASSSPSPSSSPSGFLSRAALERALQAARQEKKPALAARIGALLSRGDGAATATAPPAPGAPPLLGEGARSDVAKLADALLDAPSVPIAPRPPADPSAARAGALLDWAVGSPSLSFRLLPLLRRELRDAPAGAAAAASLPLLAGDLARAWVDLLLEEDPTSTDVLEVAAVVDGLAGRIGGAERKLTDLVYFTPDRYQGLVRAAAIWQRVGQGRLACVAWLRAARWRDEIDDPAWGQAVACTRADTGAGDWKAVLAYVLARAPAERRAALAAALDPTAGFSEPAAARAPAAPEVNDRPAGDPIPCDTGGSPR